MKIGFSKLQNISWDDIRILLAVHRTGSLLKAGHSLGLSTSTAGRRLAELEDGVGQLLVHRTQAGSKLTLDGLQLVRLAEQFEQQLYTSQRDKMIPAGTLKISVPDGFIIEISGGLTAFQTDYPNIDIEIIGEGKLADVAGREVDMAIRFARSTSNVLIERHIATFSFELFAAENYVRKNMPSRILKRSDFQNHRFVGLDSRWTDFPPERWLSTLGASRFVFRSTSIDAVIQAVKAGIGIAALPAAKGRRADLVSLTTNPRGPEMPLYLTYHRDLRDVAHFRAALDAVTASIASMTER